MDVLDAIMLILADILAINSIPVGTATIVSDALKGIFQAFVAFFELVQGVFGVLQGLSA
jgi:uncharacterized membrane protein